MQINKNNLTTSAYGLMLLSTALPALFMLLTMFFGMIGTRTSGDLSAGDGIVFIMIIIGAPFFFLCFIAGILLSFIIGLMTRSRNLLLISSIPMIAMIAAFWKTYHLEHSKGIVFDAMGTFVTGYPWWLYVGYVGLVLITSTYYFYQQYLKR